jgi:hypothetical protein
VPNKIDDIWAWLEYLFINVDTIRYFSLNSQGTPPGEAYMVAAFGEPGLSGFTV